MGLNERSQAHPDPRGMGRGPFQAATRKLFSFLYLKKQNFKTICQIGKFLKIGAGHTPNGRQGACRPSSWRQDLNIKTNLHLGLGAQGALNSELVK